MPLFLSYRSFEGTVTVLVVTRLVVRLALQLFSRTNYYHNTKVQRTTSETRVRG